LESLFVSFLHDLLDFARFGALVAVFVLFCEPLDTPTLAANDLLFFVLPDPDAREDEAPEEDETTVGCEEAEFSPDLWKTSSENGSFRFSTLRSEPRILFLRASAKL
jgi:hypothetical protein